MANYPLTLGPVSFTGFEAPNGDKGGLSDLGAVQRAVVHEFPGGIITAQLFGAFPKEITWDGILFGANKNTRSQQLKKLAVDAELVNFNFADWNYDGFVKEYKATHKGDNIEYTIVFKPLYDNVMVEGSAGQSNPNGSMLASGLTTMTSQANNPSSGGTLNDSILQGVSDLNTSANDALMQAGGQTANLPTSTVNSLQDKITTLQGHLETVVNGDDIAAASAAADVLGSLSMVSQALKNLNSGLITTLMISNPNIFQLSEQYYGSPEYFGYILDENDLFDAFPESDEPMKIDIPYVANLPVDTSPTVAQ